MQRKRERAVSWVKIILIFVSDGYTTVNNDIKMTR